MSETGLGRVRRQKWREEEYKQGKEAGTGGVGGERGGQEGQRTEDRGLLGA